MRNPNGYGSVYKLQGNRRRPYTAVITAGMRDDGRYNRKTLGYYATRKEALIALSSYNDKPYDIDNKSVTLETLFARWKEYREQRQKPVSQIYLSAFKKCERFYQMKFADIGSIHIQDMVDSVPESPVTARRIKQIFNMLYKYAKLIGLSDINHAAPVELPAIPKSTMHKPFSDEELAELWANTDEFTARLALIYCYTGLRPSELVEIRRENVHLAERYMTGGMKTEAGRDRTIPIAEKIAPFIAELYERSKGKPYLLIAPSGKRISDKDAVRMYWKKSPIPAVRNHLPHDGRHTCETLLDNARIAKRTIQLIIGHAGRDVDDSVYTHKTLSQLIDAINRI